MTLKMTSAQVIELLATNNSSFQSCPHLENHRKQSRSRSSWCGGLALSHGLVGHIGLTLLHLSPFDRIAQEKLL